jgi:hypothetical protein
LHSDFVLYSGYGNVTYIYNKLIMIKRLEKIFTSRYLKSAIEALSLGSGPGFGFINAMS